MTSDRAKLEEAHKEAVKIAKWARKMCYVNIAPKLEMIAQTLADQLQNADA